MAVADILPPEGAREGRDRSPASATSNARKSFDSRETSRANQSRLRESASPSSNTQLSRGPAGSPSKYRQLQENLRAMRMGVKGGVQLTGRQRQYGSNRIGAKQAKPESKLSNTTILVMLSAAVAIDIFQIILTFVGAGEWFINDIIDVGVEILFFIWFKIKGVNFGSTRKVASFLGTFAFGELTDGIIPTWTLEISLVKFAIRAEEKLENASPLVKSMVSKVSTGV